MAKHETLSSKKRRKNMKFSLFQIVLMVFMFLITLTMIIPLLHILARSFSDPHQSLEMNGLRIIPEGFSLINYKILLSNKDVVPSLFNSLFITLVGTCINIFFTMLAAYALTRPRLVGRGLIMFFFIAMMLFDPGILPEYMVVKSLKLMGSRWSIILVQAVNAMYLVVMMRYFSAVPQSLYEAACIDGASHFRILFRVIAPLSKAGIATITMFYGVLRWNEYYRSGIYITKISNAPLQVILRKFVVDGDITELIGAQNIASFNELAQVDTIALQYATIILAIIPILLVYPLVLKYYTKDIMAGGIKE